MDVELQVAGEPFVLHRCSECETQRWSRDGTDIAFESVTDAMRAETASKPPSMSRRRRSGV